MSAPRSPSLAYRARRIHRRLGLITGIQFLLWTAGGLYFSWVDLDEVHGDHLLRPAPAVAVQGATVTPAAAVAAIEASEPLAAVVSVDLAMVAGAPTYRIVATRSDGAGSASRVRRLVDARTGRVRGPLTRDEAVRVAQAAYTGTAPVRSVRLLTADSVSAHHEFREQPLPAWAVRFGDGEGATAYVPAEVGQVLRIRNDRWRVFDFLWMLHTMDYEGRDDFNNLLLRVFSVLGLVTIASGMTLFALTSPTLRRRRRGGGARAAEAPTIG